MKKTLRLFGILLGALALATPAAAGSFTFSSFDAGSQYNDIYDLDHYYLYIWGINAGNLPADEKIVSASLSFDDIRDWTPETDILKVYLLDNPKLNDVPGRVDVISIYDAQRTTATSEMMYYEGTRFSAGQQIWSWSDVETPGVNDNWMTHDLTYNFDLAELDLLNNYLGTPNALYNSTIGIGFDPDCHYYNKGITFTVVTARVPEPGMLLLLGTGLLGVGLTMKRRHC